MIKEDDFESNHSEKNSVEKRKQGKVSDSDWDSRLGHTEKGFDLQAVRWTDLGRKYTLKGHKKSILADIDVSVAEGMFHTIDDRFIDVNIKLHLDLENGRGLGHSLSHSKLQMRHSSVGAEHVKLDVKDGAVKKANRLVSSNQSSADQVRSQLIIYQNMSERDHAL